MFSKAVRALRPGGVLILFDPGKEQRILEDGVESWILRFVSDFLELIHGKEPYFGNNHKLAIEQDESLRLGSYQEIWFNANWVDPEEPKDENVRELITGVNVSRTISVD